MDPAPKYEHIGRRKPAAGIHIDLGQPTIVFVTVCTENRVPWVAQPEAHKLLVDTWNEARTWLVGYYLLMPDHVHLFCVPVDVAIPLNRWISYWKRLFTQNARKIKKTREP
jgi:putative transposase